MLRNDIYPRFISSVCITWTRDSEEYQNTKKILRFLKMGDGRGDFCYILINAIILCSVLEPRVLPLFFWYAYIDTLESAEILTLISLSLHVRYY